MTHPNLLWLTRWCAKWKGGVLLVATLALSSCAHRSPATLGMVRADTVRVESHTCVFLTLADGTHALLPDQPAACHAPFLRWAGRQP